MLVPIFAAAVPLKTRVEVLAVNVPLLVQFPETVRVLVPTIVNDVPEAIVMLLQTAPDAPMDGYRSKPEERITSVEAVGIAPPHQFDVVNQSVLVVPNQEPALKIVAVTSNLEVLSQPLTV